MLKRMRFRNWRSLRDVEIDDLTPITVFIGANSSGKSNILDAMNFTRLLLRDDSPLSVYRDAEQKQARTLGTSKDDPISIEYQMEIKGANKAVSRPIYAVAMRSENGQAHFRDELLDSESPYELSVTDGTGGVSDASGAMVAELTNINLPEPTLGLPTLARLAGTDFFGPEVPLSNFGSTLQSTFWFITQRWQLLGDNFMPLLSLPTHEPRDRYQIDKDGRNTVLILDSMEQQYPGIHDQLMEDLRWLLKHVKLLVTRESFPEMRLLLFEAEHPGQVAPTISAGTARLIAMLVAYYSLDMRFQEMPGLVFIEEPDTAVHPLLLENFVELLRTYTERDAPRQFILTTHNPLLLDYFKPEEVRIVRRDEHGYTTIDRVPEHIDKIWLDKYGLGEVWMTRSLGDVE